jgi:hypothetical protein
MKVLPLPTFILQFQLGAARDKHRRGRLNDEPRRQLQAVVEQGTTPGRFKGLDGPKQAFVQPLVMARPSFCPIWSNRIVLNIKMTPFALKVIRLSYYAVAKLNPAVINCSLIE